jgi:hypothetical protein
MDLGASGGGVTMLCNKGKLCSALPECCCLWDSVLIAQRKILFSFTGSSHNNQDKTGGMLNERITAGKDGSK